MVSLTRDTREAEIDDTDLDDAGAPAPVDAVLPDIYGSAQNAYETGFSSAHGARPETFESLGTNRAPETADHALNEDVPKSIDEENPGLADS